MCPAAVKNPTLAVAHKSESNGAIVPPAKLVSTGSVPTRKTGISAGAETRQRIIDATIETLRSEGITGASARCIARHGGINQALIFYHFGSVEGLLAAAAQAEGTRRAERYAAAFAAVSTLPELVTVARHVHEEEQRDGSVKVLAQMLAGSSASPELRTGVFDGMKPWLTLVQQAIDRVSAASPFRGLVASDDVAFAISSLFVGFELMTSLDTSGERANTLFDALERLAVLLSNLVGGTS